ncbi:DUF3096 domain-containing protein [Candidatus Pacearchaeota archaeon]|nr:DUF3096 domain-containing protein [Candidatus Pacearchaeota archaeon]
MFFTLSGIIAIILGILVLAFPKFLRFAVGIYLLIFGTLQLLDNFGILLSPV